MLFVKVLATIGVNIGPYVDVNLSTPGSVLDIGQLSSICILSVDNKIEEMEVGSKEHGVRSKTRAVRKQGLGVVTRIFKNIHNY